MTRPTFSNIWKQHNGKLSDKWSLYLSKYSQIFSEYQQKKISLLELGTQNGGSLEIYSKYFKLGSTFIGCDIDTNCQHLKYDSEQINLVIGDANTLQTKETILTISNQFDLIIDDGSHTSSDIIKSFSNYFPSLSTGGVYIIEDMHCSYWQECEGGLFSPVSSMAFLKYLIDILHYNHWGLDQDRLSLLKDFEKQYSISLSDKTLSYIHSIEFIDSMCIIRKKHPEENELGERVFSGNIELVTKNTKESSLPTPPQDSNIWSHSQQKLLELELEQSKLNFEQSEQERIASQNNYSKLEAQFTELTNKHNDLKTEFRINSQNIELHIETITALEDNLNRMEASLSWKITAPLRRLASKLRRYKQNLNCNY